MMLTLCAGVIAEYKTNLVLAEECITLPQGRSNGRDDRCR